MTISLKQFKGVKSSSISVFISLLLPGGIQYSFWGLHVRENCAQVHDGRHAAQRVSHRARPGQLQVMQRRECVRKKKKYLHVPELNPSTLSHFFQPDITIPHVISHSSSLQLHISNRYVSVHLVNTCRFNVCVVLNSLPTFSVSPSL